ncbi:hypothetical protein AB0D49_27815 [Streptomyces sp. NPDC048290]|uniref:hypothetical protein n=1 Tax=Streptomyces sp. NPDC048290 TaxID=3155811 RepID=UPI003416B33B
MSVRRRSGSVVLGLLVALATLFGVACLCAGTGKAPQMRSADHAAVYGVPAPDSPGARRLAADPNGSRGQVVGANGRVIDLPCLSPGHQQCDGTPVADTPTTGPVPQPQPLGLPARVLLGPAVPPAPAPRYAPPPRPPDLHVLQVLRS